MLSHTLSHGKLASSWNTTPTPAGTSSPTGLPSKLTVPSVGAVRPASVSSSVVLPQPDGPTMVTNSPAARSRSSGPSAWTRPLPDSKTLLMPLSRARTCAMPAAGRSMGPGLQILRQEAHVGDFLPIDRLLELADDLQAFDHAVHRGVIQRALAPIFDVEKMPEHLAGQRRVDVVGLGDDVGRLVVMRREGVKYIEAHPDEAADIVAKTYNINPALTREVFRHFLDIKYWSEGALNYAAMDRMVEGLKIVGKLKEPIDWQKVTDVSFLPQDLQARTH